MQNRFFTPVPRAFYNASTTNENVVPFEGIRRLPARMAPRNGYGWRKLFLRKENVPTLLSRLRARNPESLVFTMSTVPERNLGMGAAKKASLQQFGRKVFMQIDREFAN